MPSQKSGLSRHSWRNSAVIVTFWALMAGTAAAQTAPSPNEVSAVYACKSIAEDTARLACFDKAVGQLEEAQNSGDLVAISKDDIDEMKKDSFGFVSSATKSLGKLFGGGQSDNAKEDNKKASKKKGTGGLKSVEYTIASHTRLKSGRMRIVLENGQIWEQTDSERLPNIKNYKGGPSIAKIRNASLGSYLLRVNGRGTSVRVRRVK